MSALDKGLGAAAMLLAGSTIYLAWQIGVERERSSPAPSIAMTASATGPGTMRDAADENAPTTTVWGTPADDPVASSQSAMPGGPRQRASREVSDQIWKQMLELAYKDPATRQQLVEELIPDLRDEYLVLERRLKLGNTRWQEFLETLAAQEIDRRAQRANCGEDLECLRRVASTSSFALQDQALLALLGNADHQAYKDFAYSLQERGSIAALQGRLPLPQRLSDDATEALVMALSEVQRETEAEISAVGGTAVRIRFADVPTVILPHALDRTEDRIEYVREYSLRMRERAATVLSGVQLARFDELLNAMLVKMRRREEQLKLAPARG